MIFSTHLTELRLPVSPALLFVLLVLLVCVWLVYSLILRYHWNKYGHSPLRIMQMNFVYFVGSGVLIIAAAFCALLYLID